MSTPKVWFITGASTGFGLAVTRHVLEQGEIAVATLRNPSALAGLSSEYPKEKLLVLKLDVTNRQEISATFEKAREVFGRIDVVFNNAGRGITGELEASPDDVARGVFELNFWGAIHVTQETIKFFREVNSPTGGLIIQNSSVAGLMAAPGMSIYSASKFALEAVSESLAAEIDPAWKIKIVLIEPGSFRTPVLTNAVILPPHPAYSQELPASQFRKQLQSPNFPGGDVSKAAKVIYDIAQLPEPPFRVPLGKDSWRAIKAKLETLRRQLDGSVESWSEDLA